MDGNSEWKPPYPCLAQAFSFNAFEHQAPDELIKRIIFNPERRLDLLFEALSNINYVYQIILENRLCFCAIKRTLA
jgi:hypothetical protein